MTHISINLLPFEFKQEQIKRQKFYKVQIIGVTIILIMVFLTSLTIALRILQSHSILQIQESVNASEQKISDLKNTQASLIFLKDRLTTISKFLGVPSKQTSIYELVNNLTSTLISINSLSVDRSGDVIIVGLVADSASLDTLMTNLTDKSTNQNKISQISIDDLSRGKDGVYRISLKIKSK